MLAKEQRGILWASVTSEGTNGLPLLAGAGHSATPAGKWRGSAGRPSPMSATTTMGQRPSADPYTFTVTDRKVGLAWLFVAVQHPPTRQDEQVEGERTMQYMLSWALRAVQGTACTVQEYQEVRQMFVSCANTIGCTVHNSTTGLQSVLDSAVQTGLPATAGGG